MTGKRENLENHAQCPDLLLESEENFVSSRLQVCFLLRSLWIHMAHG